MPFVGRGRAARGKCCGAPQVARRSRMSGERLLSAAQFTGCFPLALSSGVFQRRFPPAFSGGGFRWRFSGGVFPAAPIGARAELGARCGAVHNTRAVISDGALCELERERCASWLRERCAYWPRDAARGHLDARGGLRRHSWPRPCGPLRSPVPVSRLGQVPSPEPDARVRAGVGGGLRTRPPVRCRDPGSGWPSDRET